jgi:Ca-activated chloride channel homolog
MVLHKTSNSIRILLIAILTLISSRSFTKDEPGKSLLLGNCRDVIVKNELGQTVILLKCPMVNIFVTVRDKQGAFRNDLSYEDFMLKEDGRKQTISTFAKVEDLPLTIGMILDYSPGMQRVLPQLQEASRAFYKKMLRPGKDQLFLMKIRDILKPGPPMRTDGQIELVQDLTSDPEKIEEAPNLIASDNLVGKFWDAELDTMLADSISYAAAKKFMLLPPGSRKTLIVLGNGYHVGNGLDRAVLNALKAGVSIFTIQIYYPIINGENGGNSCPGGGKLHLTPMPWCDYAANLQAFSDNTGGASFEYRENKNYENIFGEIAQELRSYYSFGYIPSDNKKSGCRKLDVSVKKEGLIVNAPMSYCPPSSSGGK